VSEPTFVVFNPRSGKGRGAGLVTPVIGALGGSTAVAYELTREPGDEGRITREALDKGFRRIVAVGGDGTWSNVGNAILRSGLPATLGLIPGGTGCDLAKSLDIPRDPLGAARVIQQGATRLIDVGRIEDRYFLNIAGFGYDVAVLEHSWGIRHLSGSALYVYCALRQIHSFPGFRVEVVADGVRQDMDNLLMLIVANARVFGGTFLIAPRADLADGLLDAMAFRNMGLLQRLRIMGQLARGTHESSRHVAALRARTYRLRFEVPPTYETDGEWNRAQTSDVAIDTLTAALRVFAPARI
jgi:YegS/Rv2252/BmrU family lipid kinase